MDDGKAAGSKLKWWSRPGRPVPPASAQAGPQAPAPSADRTAKAAGDAAAAAGDEEWTLPAPDRAPAAPADSGAATAEAPGVPGPAATTEAKSEAAADDAAAAATEAEAAAVANAGAAAKAEAETAAAAPAEAPAPEPAATPDAGTPDTAAPGRERSGASTVTLGRVSADGRDETAAAATAAPQGAPERPRPLHAEDPYGTPPYGGPGPWAPAPPVQRPMATPPQGTPLPAYATAAQTPAPGAAYPGPQPQPPVPPGPDGPSLTKPAPAGQEPAAPDAAETTAFVPHPGDGGPRSAASRAALATGPVPAPVPAPAPAPTGAWQQYDPWSAPHHGGPAAPVPPAGRRGRRAPLVIGAVALALLAGGVGGGVGAYVERYGGINDIKLPQAADDSGSRNPDSVAGIAQRALPGVVTLHVRGDVEQGTGTGFVLDHEGHILTNNHVVEPAGSHGEISVTFSGGQTARAKVVGQDGGYDLAVVQVEGVTGLRPLTLGDSDSVRVGDPVVAIGAPYDLANTVTSGIISAKQRPITAGGQKGDGSDVSYVDALQTDAPINPGNSGGPLVDAEAHVIGINSAIRAADTTGGPDAGAQGGSIGLGFAIPINQAKRVAEELINTGRATHPVIGVTLEMEYAGDGARVSDRSKDGRAPVVAGGPGAKAGIRAGDVITQVDGIPVHSGQELIVKVRSHRPGDTLTLSVQRGGKQRTVRLTLGSSSGS
ncbi:S1C family serine protease [Streptomyces natalensis]|uniref:PDZ domain-containing protein n=1 Tax=Streptomyces natalensis ATCC 27448 TaxID=1240678 RepID=A0A0D7CE17_9ACTN|nr:trypsin-like peptidase domain-containing protein [Streptomyces natalensis]KIZ14246.1 hypothetical protein SNA_34620 [Streptomyces natalensis ATCC 27448]